jgi:hypothetical protein
MLMVDVDRGKADAAAMSLELEGRAKDQSSGTYTPIPTINPVENAE